MTEYEDFGEDEFLDGVIKIHTNKKSCLNCKHLHENGFSCAAFPVIPIVYSTGEKEHLKSSKRYNQKNDVVWQYDKQRKWLARQRKRDKETEFKVIECGEDGDKANRLYRNLAAEGWDVRCSSWDSWPQTYTLYCHRLRKKKKKQ